ncbi:MAG: DUF4031 domain-containing protein [bacterium]
MAVFIDEPRETDFKNYTLTAHLISNDGRGELVQFGREIGMKERWLHNAGTPKEHFDLFDEWIGVAMMEGARRVSRERFFEIIQAKRNTDSSPD